PFYRPHPTIKRQLAQYQSVIKFFPLQVAVGPKQTDRYRQVEARSFFLHICRRKVNRHSMYREEEAAIVDRRADALAAFSNGHIRQPDHSETGSEAISCARRQVYLHIDN